MFRVMSYSFNCFRVYSSRDSFENRKIDYSVFEANAVKVNLKNGDKVFYKGKKRTIVFIYSNSSERPIIRLDNAEKVDVYSVVPYINGVTANREKGNSVQHTTDRYKDMKEELERIEKELNIDKEDNNRL